MNPIFGTFRHPAGGSTAETLSASLLASTETNEFSIVSTETQDNERQRLHGDLVLRERASRVAAHDLGTSILIGMTYLEGRRLRVPVGAILVRHSNPDGEVGETYGKAAGVLGPICAVPRDTAAVVSVAAVAAAVAAADTDAPAINCRPTGQDTRCTAPFHCP
ncbi:hypothetical protein QBC39DRAFT_374583 [Podospora conica]|nr:hypothetical protein QBC39DRAFT_374583 [Schizothecium conicum]